MNPGQLSIRTLFFCALVLGAGCGEPGAPDGASLVHDRTVTLRRGNGGDPGSLDPALAEDIHAFNVLLDLFEGLVANGVNGEMVPAAAERWTVSPDGLEYRFYLRQNARWSNGDALLAKHFVDGIRHVVGLGTLAPNAFLLEPIANYASVMRGDRPSSELGVREEDSRTVVFVLDKPVIYFPGILTMPVAFPRLTDVHRVPSSFKDPQQFVGNGPYLLDEWRIGSHIRLRRNGKYRSQSQVAIDVVEFFPIENPATEYNLYRTGDLDITATIPPAIFQSVRRERPEEVIVSPALAIYYLAYDLSEPPMNSAHLRKALSMAIDRNKLIELLARGEYPAYNLVPPGVSGHKPAEYAWKSLSVHDREAAARLAFLAAGYGAESPLAIKLTYDAGDVHEKVALVVSSMWREVLGVEVELEKLEWKMFLATRAERNQWQIMRFAWFGDYDDANTFADIFRSDSPQNLPGYTNRRFDESLRTAIQQRDLRRRQEVMLAAEQMFLDDYPIVPLYFLVNKHLVNPRVKGYLPNALDRHPTQTMTLE